MTHSCATRGNVLTRAQTYTHLLAQQARPDCGVAQAVIAGQTADQRGNLNLDDVGGKKATNT